MRNNEQRQSVITGLHESLRAPERSEMVDFSDIYPIITPEMLAKREQKQAKEQAKQAKRAAKATGARRGIAAAPTIIVPIEEPHPQPPLPQGEGTLGSARGQESAGSPNDKDEENLTPEHLNARPTALWPPSPMGEGLRVRSLHNEPPSPVRGRDLARQLWRLLGRRPQVRLRGHLWKLLPVWMVVNLALLILVLAAMVPRALPAAVNASCAWYTVASGDTIYAISASYHLAAATVVQANHLKSYGDITAGQRLCIPLNAPFAPAAQDQLAAASAPTNEKRTVSGPAAFIQFALPYARLAHQQTGWPVSMLLAQWGLEHGWSVPGFTGYNWGNVGALPGVPLVASGGAPGAPPNFSYAPTPLDGVNYYVAVAALPFYAAVAPAARQGGPDAAARALGASPWDAGHYTDNGSPGSSLITIMQDFNLYQYDTN